MISNGDEPLPLATSTHLSIALHVSDQTIGTAATINSNEHQGYK